MTHSDLYRRFMTYIDLSQDLRQRLSERKSQIHQLADTTQIDRLDIKGKVAQIVSTLVGKNVKSMVLADVQSNIAMPSYEFLTDTIFKNEVNAIADFPHYFDSALDLDINAEPAFMDQIVQILDRDGEYQAKRHEAFVSLAAAVAQCSDQERRNFRPIFDVLRAQLDLLINAEQFEAGNQTTDPQKNPPALTKEAPAMACKENDNYSEIVDALSRLQETLTPNTAVNGHGAIATSGFDKSLDDLQYSILGIPGLGSDTAHAMSRESLADSLIAGLNQTIETNMVDGHRRFTFNPIKQKYVTSHSLGAYGAIAVVSDEVSTLAQRFSKLIVELQPVDCVCKPQDQTAICRELDDAFADLTHDASQPTGIAPLRFVAIRDRITALTQEYFDLIGLHIQVDDHKRNLTVTQATSKSDVGILAMDRNMGLVRALFSILDRLNHLLGDAGDKAEGRIFARVVQTIDAIIPAVKDARSALIKAGITSQDQKATFAGNTHNGHDISQTLDWIERDAEKWRIKLRSPQFSKRDLAWVCTVVEQQRAMIDAFVHPDDTGMMRLSITGNRYALGVRQLRELSGLLDQAQKGARALASDTHSAA